MSVRSMVAVSLLVLVCAAPAHAKEVEIIGKSSVPVPPPPKSKKDPQPDVQLIRANAIKEAKRQATISAIDKILGPSSSKDPRVSSKIDAVMAQIADDRIVDTKAAKVGDNYEVTLKVVLDDKEFRTLLSDLGIAINTAAVRSFSILTVMDEFVTTPKDLKAPLEELVEFSSERGASMHDKSKSADSSSSDSADSVHASGNINAAGSHSGAYGGGSAHVQGSHSVNAASSSSSKSSSERSNDVAAEVHDNVTYKKLVKYQPQSTAPEKVSQAYNALMGQLQDYDLRVLDNDVFKSKHFKDAPLTIEQMQNGEALSKYVAWARTEANADYFMVGNSIIIDSGKNKNTGDYSCTGLVTVKTYSTADGEAIASETISEASAGLNLNDCAANVAKKLAKVGGPIIGARVQEYYKRRATYGREFVVTLVGANLPLMLKTNFAKALKSVPGVENDQQRTSSGKKLQIVVTYKGGDPLDQAMAAQLATNPSFATLDAKTDGNQVLFCMGSCDEVKP
ncbi:MAG TPA: hypothetical protein VGK67_33620 [Myxococcales bacterium]